VRVPLELEGFVIRGHGAKINNTLRVGGSAADVAAASKLGDEIGGCDFIVRGRVSSSNDSYFAHCICHHRITVIFGFRPRSYVIKQESQHTKELLVLIKLKASWGDKILFAFKFYNIV
jgi:hypothetical protein